MCDKCKKEIKGSFYALKTGALYCEDCYSKLKKDPDRCPPRSFKEQKFA
jgi:hypothetical protein